MWVSQNSPESRLIEILVGSQAKHDYRLRLARRANKRSRMPEGSKRGLVLLANPFGLLLPSLKIGVNFSTPSQVISDYKIYICQI